MVIVTRKLFTPPSLNCIEGFVGWLYGTEVWQCFTDLQKDKQGPAIYIFKWKD